MQPLSTLVNLVRYKLSGDRYQHNLFRVGMTLTLDPTVFILAGSQLKVKNPSDKGELTTSVLTTGVLTDGNVTLNRLYLGDGSDFLQLWVQQDGTIGECRYFSRHDQEIPEDAEDWDVWLNDQNGLIGWPQFQTLDGKLYARQWQPGDQRVAPIMLNEMVETASGQSNRAHRAMLYSAATGLAAPAPQAEYILASTVEENGGGWIDIHAGIDLNPASLSIA